MSCQWFKMKGFKLPEVEVEVELDPSGGDAGAAGGGWAGES